MDSWTEVDSAADSLVEAQWTAQTHQVTIAIMGSAIDSGTTSETPTLNVTTEMPETRTNVSGVYSRFEASLKCLNGLMTSCATIVNTDEASMMVENSGEAPLKAGDSGVMSVMV